MFNVLRHLYRNQLIKLTFAIILIICFCDFFIIGQNSTSVSIWKTYSQLSTSPEVVLFLLPTVTLFVGFDMTRVIGTDYFELIEIRSGYRRDVLADILLSQFVLAFILAMIFFLTVLFMAVLNKQSTDTFFLWQSIGDFWLQLLDIYAWLLFLTWLQVIFQKPVITFWGGLFLVLALLATIKMSPIYHYFPILPGTELFLSSVTYVPLGSYYLGLIWIIVELWGINFSARRHL